MDGNQNSAKPKEKGRSEHTDDGEAGLDLTSIPPAIQRFIINLQNKLVEAQTEAKMFQQQAKDHKTDARKLGEVEGSLKSEIEKNQELKVHLGKVESRLQTEIEKHPELIRDLGKVEGRLQSETEKNQELRVHLGEVEGRLRSVNEKNQELRQQIIQLQQNRSMTRSQSTPPMNTYEVKGNAKLRVDPKIPRNINCISLELEDQGSPLSSIRTDTGDLPIIEGCLQPVETPRPRTSGSDLEQASEPDPQLTPPDEGSDFHYSNDGANRGVHDQPTGSSSRPTAAEEHDTEDERLDQATGVSFRPANRSNERSSRYSDNIPHGLTQEQSISACSMCMDYGAATSDIQQHADNQTSDGSMHNNGLINRNIQRMSSTSSQNLHPANPQSTRPRK